MTGWMDGWKRRHETANVFGFETVVEQQTLDEKVVVFVFPVGREFDLFSKRRAAKRQRILHSDVSRPGPMRKRKTDGYEEAKKDEE